MIWCDQINLLSISMSKYLISSFSFDCSPIILMFSFMVTFLLFFQNTTRSTLRDSLFESSQLALKYCLVVLHMRYISVLRGHCLFWPLVLYYLDMIQTTAIQSLLAHDFLVLKLSFFGQQCYWSLCRRGTEIQVLYPTDLYLSTVSLQFEQSVINICTKIYNVDKNYKDLVWHIFYW